MSLAIPRFKVACLPLSLDVVHEPSVYHELMARQMPGVPGPEVPSIVADFKSCTYEFLVWF